MNEHLTVFIGLFVCCCLGTIAANIYFNQKKEKARNQYFAKENLIEYEKLVSSFLANHNIDEGLDIYTIIKVLGYELKEELKLLGNHEAEKVGNIIKVRKTLGYRAKNFVVAHEIAHDIKGDVNPAARETHSFRGRSIDEQVCDYIAAALLLPCSEMKKELECVDYENCSRKERIRFIAALADKKNVSEEVVIRRIKEIQLLTSC